MTILVIYLVVSSIIFVWCAALDLYCGDDMILECLAISAIFTIAWPIILLIGIWTIIHDLYCSLRY